MIKDKGFTLIEILTAIAILSIIFFLAIPILSDFKQTQDLKNTADNVASLLNEARAKTLASEGGNSFKILFEEDKATLFSGPSPIGSDPYLKEVYYEEGVVLEGLYLESGGDTVTFAKLSGDTLDFGNIVFNLEQDSLKTKVINILKTGLVDIQ